MKKTETARSSEHFQKRGVVASREKYQKSGDVNNELKNQFKSRRTNSVAQNSRKTLPSYQNEGIKDIVEYHHAKPYREIPVANKCTEVTANSRFIKFKQLHDYDFRKRPEFLRS